LKKTKLVFVMKRSLVMLVAIGYFVLPHSIHGQQQEKIDTAMVSRIKDEGFNRSQVMSILSMLTDVHGPRLTNSPNYKKAAEYAKSTLESWGVENVHFDTWDEEFGRGWELKKFSLQALSPVYFPVIAYPKAWSPGVKGTVQGEAVYFDIKKEEDIEKYKGKLKGKIVLFTPPTPIKPGFTPDATRLADSTLLDMANSGPSEAFTGRRFQGASAPQRLSYLKWDFCQKEGAIAIVEASPATRLEDGTLLVSSATVPQPAETPFAKRISAYSRNVPTVLPQVVMSAEQYNRMIRQIEKGMVVKLSLSLEVSFTEAAPGFNIIGEIPGTDLKDEVVMIGAHFDSWHSATGTTDNAVGSAVMLEAIRILKTLGVSPRRTIRIGLWGGEEQGLLGSRNYVKRKLAIHEDKSFPYDSIKLTPEAEKFSVYFNMDNGSGKYRGLYLQSNEAARPIFRTWLKPFEKLGAETLTIKNTSGTDHLSFDGVGLPAFQFIQDPIEYGTRTHHTSMDLYDKAVEPDLKHNAVITASFAWFAANRDALIPRK
jgi:carboxypeptidase Q